MSRALPRNERGLHQNGVIESLRESLVCQEGAIDLAIIDTGYHTCSDQEITTIIACLGDVMPGVPVVEIGSRGLV